LCRKYQCTLAGKFDHIVHRQHGPYCQIGSSQAPQRMPMRRSARDRRGESKRYKSAIIACTTGLPRTNQTTVRIAAAVMMEPRPLVNTARYR
jgi:hypothetical protein